jgi:hypothetical protein
VLASLPWPPPSLEQPCGLEFSREALLYPACIPRQCGAAVDWVEPGPLPGAALRLRGPDPAVFWALDLASGGLVSDGTTSRLEPARMEEVRRLAAQLAGMVGRGLERRYNVTGLLLTAPTVLSVIQPGHTPVPYTETHVDMYSYLDTALHLTAVLYLGPGPVVGGELLLERAGGLEEGVPPDPGRLVTFTSGEENRHRVGRVVAGDRAALTMFFTCDPDYHNPL